MYELGGLFDLAGVNKGLNCAHSETKNRRTFAIRRRFLRFLLGNAAIIALNLVGVNSVHTENEKPPGDISRLMRHTVSQ
jgi:hypothetical protein